MRFRLPESLCQGEQASRRNRRRERGSAVLVVIVVLSIMFIYVNANLKLLSQMDRELKFIEQRQLQKFQTPAPTPPETTNQVHQPLAEARAAGE